MCLSSLTFLGCPVPLVKIKVLELYQISECGSCYFMTQTQISLSDLSHQSSVKYPLKKSEVKQIFFQ